MKITFLCVWLLAVAAMANAQTATPGKTFGSAITAADAVDISTVAGQVSAAQPVPVKIKALVTDVCTKKGCWMRLRITDSTTAFVRMKDYGFFVPQDIRGKEIIIDGEAYQKETPVDELKHYAADAGKKPAEIATITQPAKELRITANGILVVK